MKWKKQYNKPNCGQIAVSVITGKPLKEVYKIIGHDSWTSTKDLTRALYFLGWDSSHKLIRLKKNDRPQLAIGKLSFPSKGKTKKKWLKDWH